MKATPSMGAILHIAPFMKRTGRRSTLASSIWTRISLGTHKGQLCMANLPNKTSIIKSHVCYFFKQL